MKKYILLLIISLFFNLCFLNAAYLRYVPKTLTQSDGSIVECFATGDENNNFLHTKDGYVIINNKDGFYVFADTLNNQYIETNYRVDKKVVPNNINKWQIVNNSFNREYFNRHRYEKNIDRVLSQSELDTNRNKGVINNIVIFVRFNDDKEFAVRTDYYEEYFNSINNTSFRNYYYEASYGQLVIKSYLYPTQTGKVLLSHKVKHNRNYYMPYLPTNTEGYKGPEAKESRKLELIEECINAVKNQIPYDLDLDYNNDNKVDNIVFVIKGDKSGWGDLLWAHHFCYTQNTFNKNYILNGKTIDNCIILPEDQAQLGVLCHEFFHALGAPDLYRYDNPLRINPMYFWDLMEYQTDIPQHMSSYMKHRYGNWIKTIPLISDPGEYILNSLDVDFQNCYRVSSTKPDEEYILEYRKPTGKYESNLALVVDEVHNLEMRFNGGLLVYKNNKASDGLGNASTSGNIDDEIYVYRPNGTLIENGYPWYASFNEKNSRDKLNNNTNPRPFLFDGSFGGLSISDIYEYEGQLHFTLHSDQYTFIKYPYDGLIDVSTRPEIIWDKLDRNCKYIVQISTDNAFYKLVENDTLENTDRCRLNKNLLPNTYYYVRVGAGNETGKKFEWTPVVIFKTAEFINIGDIKGDLCAGQPVQINYELVDNTIHKEFNFLLSDYNGNFNNNILLGTKMISSTGSIKVEIPDEVISGRNYRFKIEAVDGSIASSSRKYTIKQIPKPLIIQETIKEKICLNDIVTYSIAADENYSSNDYLKYEWEVFNGNILNIDTIAKTIEVLWRSTGQSKIKLKAININGCYNIVENSFYVHDYPNINFSGKNRVCANEEAKYYFPNNLYNFDISVLGGVISERKKDSIAIIWDEGIDSGNVHIENINENYCDLEYDFPVVINQNPIVDFIGDTLFCSETSYYEYKAVYDDVDTNAYQYIWLVEGGELSGYGRYTNTKVMWFNDTCSITLIIVNKKSHCNSSLTKLVVKTNPPNKPQIYFNEEYHLLIASEEADFYQWYLDDKPIENANSNTFDPVLTGTYYVKIRNNYKCEAVSDGFYYNSSCINNNSAYVNYYIEHNILKLLLKNYVVGNLNIELFNILGQKVYNNSLLNSSFDNLIEIPIINFTKGTYFLRIISDNHIEKIRIIL